ncbi:MAG: hypothetical protein AAGJ29_09215 [Pseudomonadota bacterium]
MSLAHYDRSRRMTGTIHWLYNLVLFPVFFVGTAMSRIFGRTLARRYVDDRRVPSNVVRETTSALNNSFWWSLMDR